MTNDYYTYAWLREDGTPYYIGKGKGKRAWRPEGPPKERVLILKKNITEAEAFKHEIYMISVFGRSDKGSGILHNFSDGGEGPSGAVRSPTTRTKISEAKKGRPRPDLAERNRQQKGVPKGPITEEHRKNLSVAGKNRAPFSEETRKRMSEAAKRRAARPEEKERRSQLMKSLDKPRAPNGRFL